MRTLLLTSLMGLAAMAGAQESNNLAVNGSFENLSRKVHGHGDICAAEGLSSSNNTSVDLYSKDACARDYKAPENGMGMQDSKTGNTYAGIVAFYADETGIFESRPGYQQYSEYIQVPLREPMIAGAVYEVSFNASLAEKSAYAVSGMGIYFSDSKMDVKNNAFLNVIPHIVSTDVMNNTDWLTFTGTYVAIGGERFLTLGCFKDFMDTVKVIPPFTNNSRKAYYYIDDISVAPGVKTQKTEDVTMILYGSCYQLNNLNFETDKATIVNSSYNELNALSNFLRTYPHVIVYIDGHADKPGTEQHNAKLSEERAKSVKEYLVSKGVREERLKARGYGESLPIDATTANSSQNRRVEITICAAK